MVVFAQCGCIRAKVVVFGQGVCIRVKLVVIGQKWLYLGKAAVLGQSGCTRAKVFFYRALGVVFEQSGFIWSK